MSADASARVWLRALVVILLLAALSAAAAATHAPRAGAAGPVLDGQAFGVELCPQQVCGAATFLGYFGGDVNGQRGGGWWVIAVRHDPLPAARSAAALTGGRWMLSSRGERTSGAMVSGRIYNNGDDTFAIVVHLAARPGGDGVPLTFTGTLDHRAFPPTARGVIAPPAPDG